MIIVISDEVNEAYDSIIGQDIKDAVPHVVSVIISIGIYKRDYQRNLEGDKKRAGIIEADDAVDRSAKRSCRRWKLLKKFARYEIAALGSSI